MLLAIDIGNTDTVVGAFANGNLINHFRVASRDSLTVDECGFFIIGLLDNMGIKAAGLSRAVIASVVPRLTTTYEIMSNKYLDLKPLIVSHKVKLPIKIIYDDPSSVGADRIANAVAAFNKFGGPIVVVDFGTATTFDIVNKRGEYLGGVIAPGPVTAGSDLAKKAARLFEVRIEKPDKVIGQNTGGAIKSGLFFGTVGQIEYIISLISDEMKSTPRVIATGGLAVEFEKYCPSIESVNTTLTLEGLKIIADFQD